MAIDYIVNERGNLSIIRDSLLSVDHIKKAIVHSNEVVEKLAAFEVDIFTLLGMRNLSSFVGEIFAASMVKTSDGIFKKNPHQDGYPDLLLMDKHGAELWKSLERNLRDKRPFSPFASGGVEVKATCGSVPTPAECAKKGLHKPDMGDQRISFMKGYDWKAHHRETNALLGLFWDFVDRKPIICGVYYCNTLTPDDWGKIIQPKEDGGRTTSVSIMTRKGVRKMYDNWVMVINDPRYIDFFNRYNSGTLLRSATKR